MVFDGTAPLLLRTNKLRLLFLFRCFRKASWSWCRLSWHIQVSVRAYNTNRIIFCCCLVIFLNSVRILLAVQDVLSTCSRAWFFCSVNTPSFISFSPWWWLLLWCLVDNGSHFTPLVQNEKVNWSNILSRIPPVFLSTSGVRSPIFFLRLVLGKKYCGWIPAATN